MAIIQVLDSFIFNRIAAGEVVERPASVVKELVENAIDAGASCIKISIMEGGKRQIVVGDDGCGIDKEYMKTAFLPHATSKISRVEDLEKIGTLGFRGEALASIASVGMVTVQSRVKGKETGYELRVRGGNFEAQQECGSNEGSQFVVDNLFFNAPARAKFLKSNRAEENEITDMVSRFVLSNPNIRFEYQADGKMVYSSEGNGPLSALCAVYGSDIFNQVLEVKDKGAECKVAGYIGRHDFVKSTRAYQTIIMNGRFISDIAISACIQNAYSNYLMKRQFPFFVLNLEVPLDAVDVNVHPNKREVRFEDPNRILGILYNVVQRALSASVSSNLVFGHIGNEVNVGTEKKIYQNTTDSIMNADRPLSAETNQSGKYFPLHENTAKRSFVPKKDAFDIPFRTYGEETNVENEQKSNLKDVDQSQLEDEQESPRYDNEQDNSIPDISYLLESPKKHLDKKSFQSGQNLSSDNGQNTAISEENGQTKRNKIPDVNVDIGDDPILVERTDPKTNKDKDSNDGSVVAQLNLESSLNIQSDKVNAVEEPYHEVVQQAVMNQPQSFRFCGQLFSTYVLVESGETVFLIDQHAAHERLLYDKLVENSLRVEKAIQTLMIPYVFTIHISERSQFEQQLFSLRDMGFEIEEEGSNYAVQAVPLLLADMNLGEYFDGILLRESGEISLSENSLKENLMQRACKAAIKGGDMLSEQEAKLLLSRLQETNMELLCPHGRPIVLQWSKKQIEKKFKRIV